MPSAATVGTGCNQDALQRGLDWVDRYFDPKSNPSVEEGDVQDHGWWWYHAYCVERVRSGHRKAPLWDPRLVPNHCRPHVGTEVLNERMRHWFATGTHSMPLTAFALMFLSRGRVPVAINKLVLDPRHRTAAHAMRPTGPNTSSRPPKKN